MRVMIVGASPELLALAHGLCASGVHVMLCDSSSYDIDEYGPCSYLRSPGLEALLECLSDSIGGGLVRQYSWSIPCLSFFDRHLDRLLVLKQTDAKDKNSGTSCSVFAWESLYQELWASIVGTVEHVGCLARYEVNHESVVTTLTDGTTVVSDVLVLPRTQDRASTVQGMQRLDCGGLVELSGWTRADVLSGAVPESMLEGSSFVISPRCGIFSLVPIASVPESEIEKAIFVRFVARADDSSCRPVEFWRQARDGWNDTIHAIVEATDDLQARALSVPDEKAQVDKHDRVVSLGQTSRALWRAGSYQLDASFIEANTLRRTLKGVAKDLYPLREGLGSFRRARNAHAQSLLSRAEYDVKALLSASWLSYVRNVAVLRAVSVFPPFRRKVASYCAC